MSWQPRWVLVDGGRHRCQVCGEFVGRAWHWYERPAVSTRCVCEPCAARLAAKP